MWRMQYLGDFMHYTGTSKATAIVSLLAFKFLTSAQQEMSESEVLLLMQANVCTCLI